GDDAVGLVNAALVPQLLYDPPHRLHERRIHRLVVVVEVDPAARARHRRAPFGDVALHHRAALLVERGDADLADVGRALQTERLLRQVLDGKAVAVPAEATLDVVAAHAPVARDDVLDRADEEVTVVGRARRERRP